MAWKAALQNIDKAYLTAQGYGYTVDCTSKELKFNQWWSLIPDEHEDNVFYFRSSHSRYLSVGEKERAFCDRKRCGETEKFSVVYHPDETGQWAFKHLDSGCFLGGTGKRIMIREKKPTETEWWIVQLYCNPHVNIKCLGLESYAHYSEEHNAVEVNKPVPWGANSLFSVNFKEGKYTIQTTKQQYLSDTGKLVANLSDKTEYFITVYSGPEGGIAFRGISGKFLCGGSPNGLVKCRSKIMASEEMFCIEESHIQVFFTSRNSKHVSIRQSRHVSANQSYVTDKEIFQVEHEKGETFRLATVDRTYWCLDSTGAVMSTDDISREGSSFTFEWQDNGAVLLKACNGRYLHPGANGMLNATSDRSSREDELFVSINREVCFLKSPYGFTGPTSDEDDLVICNKTEPFLWTLEHNNGRDAEHYFKAPSGCYLSLGDKVFRTNSVTPQPFRVHFMKGKVILLASNDLYVTASHDGTLSATGIMPGRATPITL